MSHGGIKIVLNMFVTETRLETGPVSYWPGKDFIYYKEKEKLCKKVLHDTQQKYWENYCSSLNNNSKLSQMWYNVKQMLGNAPSKKQIPTLIQNDIPYESTTCTEKSYLQKISVTSVVLTIPVVILKIINNWSKKMTITILHLNLTIIIIVIMINLPSCRK